MTSPRLMIPTRTPFLSTGTFLICFFPKMEAMFSSSSFQEILVNLRLAISRTLKFSSCFPRSSNSS